MLNGGRWCVEAIRASGAVDPGCGEWTDACGRVGRDRHGDMRGRMVVENNADGDKELGNVEALRRRLRDAAEDDKVRHVVEAEVRMELRRTVHKACEGEAVPDGEVTSKASRAKRRKRMTTGV